MKKTISSFLIVLFLHTAVFQSTAFADDQDDRAMDAAPVAPADNANNSNGGHNVIRGTGLCLGGALVGSVVPIVGTVVGCAGGIVYAWYTRR